MYCILRIEVVYRKHQIKCFWLESDFLYFQFTILTSSVLPLPSRILGTTSSSLNFTVVLADVCMVPCTKVNDLGLGPTWQACPWEHMPNSSAPCAVPMRLSRIVRHIEDEPCAKQRALFGVLLQPLLKRFSRTPDAIFS